MQAAISDLSSALVKMMDYVVSRFSAMLADGYECKQTRDYTGASGWAHLGHRQGLETWKLSFCFCDFYLLGISAHDLHACLDLGYY